MLVRPYTQEDLPEVKALHAAQGFDYELPDLEASSMLVRAVIEDKGRVTDAVFLRKTSEAYWCFDPGLSHKERVGRMLILNKEMMGPAARAGFEDIHAFLPPLIMDSKLHKTLLRIGWFKPLWVCYSRKVGA
jgi:hypothetical protein